MGYTVLRLDELEWSTPSAGDQTRGIVRLSEGMMQMRGNIWRLPPGTRGRRHAERVQEEVFVVLAGTATMALGDPPEFEELPVGSVVVVEPGTALQQLNRGDEDAVILSLGAPPEEPGNAEYLPDTWRRTFDLAYKNGAVNLIYSLALTATVAEANLGRALVLKGMLEDVAAKSPDDVKGIAVLQLPKSDGSSKAVAPKAVAILEDAYIETYEDGQVDELAERVAEELIGAQVA